MGRFTIILSWDSYMPVQIITISPEQAGQRIDNFLITFLKGVPHSRVYRALRKGEVRVNKGRVQATYRLQSNDHVRIPPVRVAETTVVRPSDRLMSLLENAILIETEDFIVINKPVGVAVHAGSEVACGVIEALRFARPELKGLSLAHRLDRETSGCLFLAKNRKALLAFQSSQKIQAIEKKYLLLVKGRWTRGEERVSIPLSKNELISGERMVVADEFGKSAITIFEPVTFFEQTTLLRATLVTGRTHQIRVHAAELGHPIVGDPKYGDREFNKRCSQKRLCLHAEQLRFKLSASDDEITVIAPETSFFED